MPSALMHCRLILRERTVTFTLLNYASEQLLGWSVLVITSWATYNICYNKLVEVSMVELSRALAALSKSN